jgi:NAD(P)-dependent dehydrogenase (short-subunit alcohol dehydrogenase family)
MARGGNPDLSDPQWSGRRWNGAQAYSDSKLFDMLLAFGVARRWPQVRSNSVEPGWVPTRMGGPGAPDDLDQGAVTQAWLAVGDDKAAKLTGRHFYHRRERSAPAEAHEPAVQDALLDYCAELTGASIS